MNSSKARANATCSAHQMNSGPGGNGGSPPGTILLVSSDHHMRARIRAFLESEDLRVFSSADLEFASEIVFCTHDINILVVDQDSLGVRGLELASELVRSRPQAIVIVLAGVLTPLQVIEKGYLLGWKTLIKPLSLPILLGEIRKTLNIQGRSLGPVHDSGLLRRSEVILFPSSPPYPRRAISPRGATRSSTLLRGDEEAS